MDKYEITDDLLFQHCTNVENFILEQIPDEEDIDYEYPKEFEKKKWVCFLIKYAYIQKR